MPNRYTGNQWTLIKLRRAFDRFEREHGHIPTAIEVDQCDYLPTSRQIQRAFGGLRKVREGFGYPTTDFNSGDSRREILKKIAPQGRTGEKVVEEILVTRFGELFVHSEKHYFESTRSRADFYVYTLQDGFGVEVFTTDNLINCKKIVALKLNQYKNYPHEKHLYFVIANDIISQKELDFIPQSNKRFKEFADFVELVNLSTFTNSIQKFTPLATPSGFVPMKNEMTI